MKKHIILLAAIICFTGMLPPMAQRANAQGSVSFQVFYDQLSPYGSWVSYPDYGYVWVPGADAGFRPYGTRGHWVYKEDGWTWVSDYSWGWATFHYGNWFYDDSYGWMWTPGYEWAPAWVTWGATPSSGCSPSSAPTSAWRSRRSRTGRDAGRARPDALIPGVGWSGIGSRVRDRPAPSLPRHASAVAGGQR